MDAMKLYQQWLTDFANDPDTVADLKAIENDPKEIAACWAPAPTA